MIGNIPEANYHFFPSKISGILDSMPFVAQPDLKGSTFSDSRFEVLQIDSWTAKEDTWTSTAR